MEISPHVTTNISTLFVMSLVPNPVLNVVASPKSTTSVVVKWSYPEGAQSYYQYLIKICNAAGPSVNKTVVNNSTDVFDLEPGTRYNISVKTRAAPGSESTEEKTFTYTSKILDLNADKLQKP